MESANKSDLSRKTKVLIQNSEFQLIDTNFESVIELNEGADLEIRNSIFNQISTLGEGAIIYAGYQETETRIYDSSFTNNTAVKASLFDIDESGSIKLYNVCDLC